MAENQLIFGLKRQYARTLGLVEAGDAELTEDLAHLAAVIRMFEPFADLTAILPVRPYRANRDRWSRDALAVLRGANAPMTARDIAKRVLAARGTVPALSAVQRVECSLYAVLERLEGRGVARKQGSPKRWSVD